METIFKEGMKVYDSFNFPNKEGIIETIRKDNVSGDYIIGVLFGNSSDYQYYSIDGRLDDSRKQTLSTHPYEVCFIGFEQRPTEDTDLTLTVEDLSKEITNLQIIIFELIHKYNSIKDRLKNEDRE